MISLISCQNNTEGSHISESFQQSSASPAQTNNETQKMVSRMAKIAKMTDPMQHSFMNIKRLKLLQVALSSEITPRNMSHFFQLAHEHLRAGNAQQAAKLFEQILHAVEQQPSAYQAGASNEIRRLAAISHMRYGEQSNCIMLHGNDSCIFPISSTAIHLNQQGSKKAMQHYRHLLNHNDDDIVSKWLFNIAAQTLGEYPDHIEHQWLIPMSIFESKTPLKKFPNIAPNNHTNLIDLAGSVITEDFNNDGYLDIMASAWGFDSQLRLLLNNQKGQFTDATAESGIEGLTGGLNMVQADYDNDGDMDVLLLRGAWLVRTGRHPNSLLRNNGDGSWTDVTESSGILSFHPTQTAAWADIDNDGWLDVFIGNESLPNVPHSGELYHNQGNGTFINIADQVGLDTQGFVKGAVWGDYDNDGKIDLYVSRMNNTNLLMKNTTKNGQIQFIDVAKKAGVEKPIMSFPTWFWDYDNDGWLDIFVADFSDNAYATNQAQTFSESQAHSIIDHYLNETIPENYPRIFHNQGDGTFKDVTLTMGLKQPLLAMGANFGDLNNDGYLDMYIGTGSPDFRTIIPNRMFLNEAGQRFIDVTHTTVTGHLQKGHGIAFADMDNDGDQDIYAVMGGAYQGDVFQNAFFDNPGFDNHWITIKLQGNLSNRNAIGARVTLMIDDQGVNRQIHRQVSSGGSFGGNSLQLEIGLGQAQTIDTLNIDWPSGNTTTLSELATNQIVSIVEGKDILISQRNQ